MNATPEQRRILLTVACPWCHACVGEFCRAPSPRRRREWSGAPRVLTHLDGASHEARWSAAGLLAGARS